MGLDFKEIEHLAGVLIKLYGMPYDQNISNEGYRLLLKLASQERKTGFYNDPKKHTKSTTKKID